MTRKSNVGSNPIPMTTMFNTIDNKSPFTWDEVETSLEEKRSDWSKPPDIEPQEGFKWHWVDNIRCLSGVGGWVELDIPNKKQGRFYFCCMS